MKLSTSKQLVTHPKLSVETQFAQKLADNDPIMRQRALKKLRRWLSMHKTKEEQKDVYSHEFMRVWKGLFYSFWMADKMLPQEQLAQAIATLSHAFESFELSLSFVRCGLMTLGREWLGIDRQRLDKFMMLTRRLIRESFTLLKNGEWDLDQCIKMSKDVFGKAVVTANNESVVSTKVSLAFQMHVVDVFLEELAKVGGAEGIEQQVIWAFVQPFALQFIHAKCDDRLRENIEERIFKHLMRQSDLGIAHEEMMARGATHVDEDMLEADDDKDDDDDVLQDDTPKDPRAGKVDVAIPQLILDFKELANQLIGVGSNSKVKAKQRKRMFELAQQFQMLEDGKYPLMVDVTLDQEDYMTKGQLAMLMADKESSNMASEEDNLSQTIREERQQYQQDLKTKRKQQRNGLINSRNDDNDEDEKDEEDVVQKKRRKNEVQDDGVFDSNTLRNNGNFAEIEIVDDQEEEDEEDDDEVQIIEDDDSDVEILEMDNTSMNDDEPNEVVEDVEDEQGENTVEAKGEQANTKKKKKRNRKKSSHNSINGNQVDDTAEITAESAVVCSKNSTEVTTRNFEANSSITEAKAEIQESLTSNGTIEETSPHNFNGEMSKKKKKKTKKGKKNPDLSEDSRNSTITNDDHISASTETPKSSSASLSSSATKRINFSMTRNRYQSVAEHSASVESSPSIPFDSEKRPKQGVLKNKEISNSLRSVPKKDRIQMYGKKALMRNTRINSKSTVVKRMWASDFF